MARPCAWVMLLVLAGCRQTPTLGTFQPFGATRVPPPGTGSVGAADSYYPRGRTSATDSPAANGLAANPAPTGVPTNSLTSATTTNPAPNTYGVAPASHFSATPGIGGANQFGTARVVSSPILATPRSARSEYVEQSFTSARATPSLGMRVNDLTAPAPRPGEPARFQPPKDVAEITDLPRTSDAPQFRPRVSSDLGASTATDSADRLAASRDAEVAPLAPNAALPAAPNVALQWKTKG